MFAILQTIKNMPLEPIEERDLDLEGKFSGQTKESVNPEKKIIKPEREISKEVSSAEKDAAYNKIVTKVQSQSSQDLDESEIESEAENVVKNTDAESQISHLVDIASNKGVLDAVKVARHMEDNYVLDMFHDRLLADELHDALVKKGLIKEI